jgi:hypothetical protein
MAGVSCDCVVGVGVAVGVLPTPLSSQPHYFRLSVVILPPVGRISLPSVPPVQRLGFEILPNISNYLGVE